MPLRWALVLENYPPPYQATKETWRALQVFLWHESGLGSSPRLTPTSRALQVSLKAPRG